MTLVKVLLPIAQEAQDQHLQYLSTPVNVTCGGAGSTLAVGGDGFDEVTGFVTETTSFGGGDGDGT